MFNLVLEVINDEAKEALIELLTEQSCIFDIWDSEHEILYDSFEIKGRVFTFYNISSVYIIGAFLSFLDLEGVSISFREWLYSDS